MESFCSNRAVNPHLKSICIIGTTPWVNILMDIEQKPTPLENKEETLNSLVLFCTGSILAACMCHWHPHWTVAAKMSKGLIEWVPVDGGWPHFGLARGSSNNPHGGHFSPHARTFSLPRGALDAETDHLFETDVDHIANISRSIRHHLGSNHHPWHHSW